MCSSWIDTKAASGHERSIIANFADFAKIRVVCDLSFYPKTDFDIGADTRYHVRTSANGAQSAQRVVLG